jgi:DNA replication protein DnaC
LIREAIGIPARNPEAATLEAMALAEMRAQAAQEHRECAGAADSRRSGGIVQAELASRMRAAGAPPERVADWLGWYDTAAGALVRAWLADIEHECRPGILVLTGGPGTGKTVAALEAVAWAIKRPDVRGPARYATMRALLALGRWGEDADPWDRAMDARMLVLDELVGEGLDRYRSDRLEELLCRRYDTGRPTVITTNLAPVAILATPGPFGARVASRLGDASACRVVECGTEDMRRAKR